MGLKDLSDLSGKNEKVLSIWITSHLKESRFLIVQ